MENDDLSRQAPDNRKGSSKSAAFHTAVDDIRGDFTGGGSYGRNTAAARPDTLHRGGIVLERTWMEPDQDIWPIPAASSRCAAPGLRVERLADTTERAAVRITGAENTISQRHTIICQDRLGTTIMKT
jgi:hypothetical protein